MNTITPSPLSRLAVLAGLLILQGTAVFLVLRYPAPEPPVHFTPAASRRLATQTIGGVAAVFVRLACRRVLAIAALLLSRSTEGTRPTPDVRASPPPGRCR
jgi:hypothetical protein